MLHAGKMKKLMLNVRKSSKWIYRYIETAKKNIDILDKCLSEIEARELEDKKYKAMTAKKKKKVKPAATKSKVVKAKKD